MVSRLKTANDQRLLVWMHTTLDNSLRRIIYFSHIVKRKRLCNYLCKWKVTYVFHGIAYLVLCYIGREVPSDCKTFL